MLISAFSCRAKTASIPSLITCSRHNFFGQSAIIPGGQVVCLRACKNTELLVITPIMSINHLSTSFPPTLDEKNDLLLYIYEAKEYFRTHYNVSCDQYQLAKRMQKFIKSAVVMFLKNQASKRVQKSLSQLHEESSNHDTSSEDTSTETWPSEAAHISARVVSSLVLNASRFFPEVDQSNVLEQLQALLRDKAVDFYSGCSHYTDWQMQDAFEKELKAVLEQVVVTFFNERLRGQDGNLLDCCPFEGGTDISDIDFLTECNRFYGDLSFDLDLMDSLSAPSLVTYEQGTGTETGTCSGFGVGYGGGLGGSGSGYGGGLGDSWSDYDVDVSFDMSECDETSFV
eukprot:gene13435-28484_t